MGGRLFGGLTMVDTTSRWEDELRRWLEPFLDRLGHKARRRMCPLYVSGLIGPGDRKSVQPMAARLAPGDDDQLHHFIADGVWDEAPLEAELLVQADRLVGGKNAVLVIDDTSMPKKGDRSVGVAPQYASTLGKTANCQTLVSLTLARGEVPVMVALRLFIPENWTSDPARLKRAGVPIEHRTARSKPEIALAEIDRVIAASVRFGCVLADAGYGSSAPFRHALSKRGLLWAVGMSRRQKVYPTDVTMIFPTEKARKPRKHHIPDMSPVSAETMLVGPKHRVFDKGVERMPGDEVWILGERRSSGEQKYYISNLPADVSLKTLAAAVKARWICEQAHQQLKEELGLDHFEGRSWQGLHRHALMTMIAYVFLQHRRLAHAGRKKKNQRTSASANHARRTSRHRRSHPSAAVSAVPILPKANS